MGVPLKVSTYALTAHFGTLNEEKSLTTVKREANANPKIKESRETRRE
jgi:hypothetical protein